MHQGEEELFEKRMTKEEKKAAAAAKKAAKKVLPLLRLLVTLGRAFFQLHLLTLHFSPIWRWTGTAMPPGTS